MPLFACSQCKCVEDTALCHFWGARVRQTAPLCSACDPAIRRWHGEFARESAESYIKDRNGFLFDKRTVERWLGQPIEIFAKPEPPPRPTRLSVHTHVSALEALADAAARGSRAA